MLRNLIKSVCFLFPMAIILFGKGYSSSLCESDIQGEKEYILTTLIAIDENKMSNAWLKAIANRADKRYIDSLANIRRNLTEEEQEWVNLIESRLEHWKTLPDSLSVPFGSVLLDDTTIILVGYLGTDDAFTYKNNTICFDITALERAYGSANNIINIGRIDRLFAHEYTHLLTNKWAASAGFKCNNFKDSLLWECFYEGLGMYRSMSKKWHPIGDSLSEVARVTFTELYATFYHNMVTINSGRPLTDKEKYEIQKHVSKGGMKQKWGALPVAVWLALESKGDDKNLIPLISKGSALVVELSLKYLPDNYSKKLKY